MTDKEKKKKDKDNQTENSPTCNGVADNPDNNEKKTLSAEEIIAKAVADAEEFKGVAQRIQADFDNYRKRNNDSVKTARLEGNNEVIINLLPVADSIEIALKVIPDEKSREGVSLIFKQLQTLFKKYGISEIDAQGESFNPDLHNAVMQVEDEANSGKVIEVLQKGYMRDGKVIRYAMVKVAK